MAEQPYEIVGWTNPGAQQEERCMKATRQLDGSCEHVLKEEAIAHAATMDVCDTCLQSGTDMHVCSRCKSMTYCNEACQRKAWKGWHKKECAMLASLKQDEGATPTPTLMMTFRTLVKCASDLQGGFLGELVHHLDTMPQERRDMYAQLAVLLNSMCRRAGMPELSMQEALTLFAKLEVNSFSILDKTLTTTAYGVYRTASCVNHSCEPNMVAAFSGRDIYLRPIRDIEKGDELTISYVELAALTETRRVELQDRYGFKCACTRCTGAEGQKMERDLPPTLLAEGNVLISDLIEKKEFTAALTKCMDLLPFMALYGVDLHPSVGMHWFNIAKLRWFLEDTDGTYEAGMIAVSIFRSTLVKGSPMLREAADLTAQAHRHQMGATP